jgi:hypothetical protein
MIISLDTEMGITMPKGVYARGEFSKHKNCRSNPSLQFWKRVNKSGPLCPGRGRCWTWLAGKYGSGYGQFRGGRAHRFAYKDKIGPIPSGLLVLHHCDNPGCVNPSHLFLGTQQDNMDDKYAKGRQGQSGTKTPPTGERNVKAKLTEKKVLQARRWYARGYSIREISYKIGSPVCLGSLKAAVLGRTWSHL